MNIKIPADEDFDFYSCKKLFKEYKQKVGDNASFNRIIKNTFFYSFYDDTTLVGCIYVYKKREKLFINAFAKRKFYDIKIMAIKKILKWFNCDMYAESVQKPAILILLRCGFERLSENVFVYYKNGVCRKGL